MVEHMDTNVSVDLDVLERAFPILIKHLREVTGNNVSLSSDHYWSGPAEYAHDMNVEPAELSVGQVSECMEWLTALAEDPEHALTYHLVWFADVLRAVGQANPR